MNDDFGLPDSSPNQPKPIPKPVKPVVPVSNTAFAWGLIGTHTVSLAGSHSDMHRITREVDGGVNYYPPPTGGDWLPLDNSIQFQMLWPTNPIDVRSIGFLGRELRQLQQANMVTADDPRLAAFDQAISFFLQTTGKLHTAQWTVGLACPENIYIRYQGGEGTAILPDLGFFWEGDLNAPAWLDPDKNPGSPYWGSEPRQRQFAWQKSPELIAEDIRVVARIIGGAVLGRIPTANLPSNAPCWENIGRALNGEFASCAEFRTALNEHPLSEHFYQKTITKNGSPGHVNGTSRSSSTMFVMMGILALAVGVAATIYYVVTQDKPVDVAQNTPNANQSTATQSKNGQDRQPDTQNKEVPKVDIEVPATVKKEVEDIQKAPAKDRGSLFGSLFAKFKDLKPSEQQLVLEQVEKARAEYIADWIKRFHVIQDQALTSIDQLDAQAQVNKMLKEYEQYFSAHQATDEKNRLEEKKCQDFAKLFLQQLR